MDGNNYPVEKTNIEVTVPQNVEEVYVYSRGTYLTNGKSEQELSDNEWTYNKETNLLQINLSNNIQTNEAGENIVSWKKDGIDQIIVTYVLAEDYELQKQKNINTSSKITLYDGVIGNESSTIIEETKEISIEEEKDGIITGKFSSNENQIYKGKIYSGEDREIDTTLTVDIRYASVEENITISEISNTFQAYTQNEQTQEKQLVKEMGANLAINKTTIAKDQILNILGEEGNIVIEKSGEEILTLNKALIDELEQLNQSESENKTINQNNIAEISLTDNNIVINYTDKQTGLIFVIKNAEKQGTINIHNTQVIQNSGYGKEELKQINNLSSIWTIQQGEQIKNKELKNDIALLETTTKANFNINNSTLTAGQNNSNVQIQVLLRNDKEEYELFQNPYFEIELPQEIGQVEIKNIKILYGDSLTDATTEISENGTGKKVIKVTLSGNQQHYQINDTIKGTYVLIDCNMFLNSETKIDKGTVNLKYMNNEKTQVQVEQKEFEYIVPVVQETLNSVQSEATTNIEETIENNEGEEQNSTTDGTELTLTKTVSVGDNTEVKERQLLKYSITVKNNTNEDTSYVTITDEIPEEIVYATYVTNRTYNNGYIENLYVKNAESEIAGENVEVTEGAVVKKFEKVIRSIPAKSEVTVNYYAIVKQNSENIGKTFGTTATATISGTNAIYTSNATTNTIAKGQFEISIASTNPIDAKYKEGDTIGYIIKIRNLTEGELNDVVVSDILPNNLTYTESYYIGKDEQNEYSDFYMEEINDVNYDEGTNNVKWNIGTLASQEEKAIVVRGTIKEYSGEVSDLVISNKAEVSAQDVETVYSNTINIDRYIVEGTVEMESSVKETYIDEKTYFDYTITIKNMGEDYIYSELYDNLPTGIVGSNLNYTLDGVEYSEDIENNTNIVVPIRLVPKGKAVITISVYAQELEEGQEQLEITNVATLENITSNSVTNIIVKSTNNNEDDNPNENPDDGDSNNPDDGKDDSDGNNTNPGDDGNNSNEEGKYSISGLVWIDKDNNGLRNLEEETMKGINVNLLRKSDMYCISSTTTKDDGTYIFEGLEPNTYIVEFQYDSTMYKVTECQKENVSEDRNSDVISTADNSGKGYTEEITITNSNITNIDMGLVIMSKFDLKLDKTVSSIAVKNDKENKTIDYNDSKLAKVEIHAKQISSSVVVVTYKINVTNEGEIPGYVNKVVDYIPKGMEFNSSLNRDWYETNGILISNSLAGQAIDPGETKTLELVLIKDMTSTNIGTVSNSAEIAEATNSQSILDIDSTPNNKNVSEDDYSTANVIISIKTGEQIMLFTLILAIIIIPMGIGIYLIQKKVLNRDIKL